MTKSNITQYDNTAANNTDVEDVPLGENQMYPADVNNAFREVMADLADVNDGTVALTSPSFASATMTGDLSFGDNNKAIFGAGSDLEIYHDGSNSIVKDAGTGSLEIQGSSWVILKGATSGNWGLASLDGAQTNLYHNGSLKLGTTATGVDITGNATFDDSGKAIFGAGTDLQIYHDGSNSAIQNATGELFVYGGGDQIRIRAENGEESIVANPNSSVDLYHNGSAKLATTSTGIDVTGTASTDGLTVIGAAYIQSATAPQLELAYNSGNITGFYRSGGDFQIKNDNGAGTPETSIVLAEDGAVSLYYDASAKLATTSTGVDVTGTVTADGLTVSDENYANPVFSATNTSAGGYGAYINTSGFASSHYALRVDRDSGKQALRVDGTGDISFYNSAGTSQSLFWDASWERLGLGTTSPATALDVRMARSRLMSLFLTLLILVYSLRKATLQT